MSESHSSVATWLPVLVT